MNDKPLWKREPAQLIGLIVGTVVTIGTFLTQVIGEVGPEATWQKFLLSAGLLLISGGQGRITREAVYSPATYERDVFGMRQADEPR